MTKLLRFERGVNCRLNHRFLTIQGEPLALKTFRGCKIPMRSSFRTRSYLGLAVQKWCGRPLHGIRCYGATASSYTCFAFGESP